LHAYTPAELSRAGNWQNTSAHTRERAGSIPLGPPGSATPPSSPPIVTPSGSVYHRRRSCAARRTRTVLLLPRPPQGWRELVVPGYTASPPSLSRPTAAFTSQLLLPTCRAISAPPPPRGSRPTLSYRASACQNFRVLSFPLFLYPTRKRPAQHRTPPWRRAAALSMVTGGARASGPQPAGR
jgi:hypothetical protein